MVKELSQRTSQNRDWWNRISDWYQEHNARDLEGGLLWGPSMPPEDLLQVLGPSVKGKDALEVCCGGGQSAVHLAQKGARVVGVDFSTRQLEHAKRLARAKDVQIRFIEANAEDLSMLEQSSFDLAFSAYAFGFIEDIMASFREVYRVLRVGGLFAFSWMSPLYPIAEEKGLAVSRSYFDRTPIVQPDEYGTTEVDFHRTYGDWHHALTQAGFVVTEILEPEPLSHENAWSDVFPLAKIRMIPGTTIWKATKPRNIEF